jgi:hypothetical protein
MHHAADSAALGFLGAGAIACAAQGGTHRYRCRSNEIALRKRVCAYQLLANELVACGKSGVVASSLAVKCLRTEKRITGALKLLCIECNGTSACMASTPIIRYNQRSKSFMLTFHSLSDRSLLEKTGYVTCEQNGTNVGVILVQRLANRGARRLAFGIWAAARFIGYSAPWAHSTNTSIRNTASNFAQTRRQSRDLRRMMMTSDSRRPLVALLLGTLSLFQ